MLKNSGFREERNNNLACHKRLYIHTVHRLHIGDVQSAVSNDIAVTACFCILDCKLYIQHRSTCDDESCEVLNYPYF